MGIAIVKQAAACACHSAGAVARGEFHCRGCGYGITVHRVLPSCPMCRGEEWLPIAGRRLSDLFASARSLA